MIESIILGIVEGITEFLPISSTGHLILASRVLGLLQTEFWKSFEIAIQLGAIFSIIFLYWKIIFTDKKTIKKILFAFLPTAVIGLSLYSVFKKYFFSEKVVLAALFLGGIFLIIFEIFYKEKENSESEISQISYKKSFLIGIFQSLAIVPGVSRAAATIIGGLFLGIKRKTIVEFSFLLAVPTMLSATAFDLVKSSASFTAQEFLMLAVGFAVSFIAAIASVKWLLYYLKRNNFILFGIYRIILAAIFYFVFFR